MEAYVQAEIPVAGSYQQGYQGYYDGEKHMYYHLAGGAAIRIFTGYDRNSSGEVGVEEARLMTPDSPGGNAIFTVTWEQYNPRNGTPAHASRKVHELGQEEQANLLAMADRAVTAAYSKTDIVTYLHSPGATPSVIIALTPDLRADPDIYAGAVEALRQECAVLYQDICRDDDIRPGGCDFLGDRFPTSAAGAFLDRLLWKGHILGLDNVPGQNLADAAARCLQAAGETEALSDVVHRHDSLRATLRQEDRLRREVQLRDNIRHIEKSAEKYGMALEELAMNQEEIDDDIAVIRNRKYPLLQRLFRPADHAAALDRDAKEIELLKEKRDENQEGYDELESALMELRGQIYGMQGSLTPASAAYGSMEELDAKLKSLQMEAEAAEPLANACRRALEQDEQQYDMVQDTSHLVGAQAL